MSLSTRVASQNAAAAETREGRLDFARFALLASVSSSRVRIFVAAALCPRDSDRPRSRQQILALDARLSFSLLLDARASSPPAAALLTVAQG